MAKGLAVISGSSTVVVQILEDGRVEFGTDVQVSASISGSLVLELQGTEASGKYLGSDAVGSASWGTIIASEITVTPVSNVTSSTVQSAIEELSNDIAAGGGGGGGSGSLRFSDGDNSELITMDGGTLIFSGTANQITASYTPAANTFIYALTNDVTIPNDLTVTTDFVVGASVHQLTAAGRASFSGSVEVTGAVIPDIDGTRNLGVVDNRWNDIFAVQTTVGAIFETGLTTKGIGEYPTGTVVVWDKNLKPCTKSEDPFVLGVTKHGKDQPIILGAEPVLVTGKVKPGDMLVTSNKLGHAKAAKLKCWWFFKRNLTGKIIGQALESYTGNSGLVRCMILRI